MWGSVAVPTNSSLDLSFGPLAIHVQRVEDEWLFAHSIADDGADAQSQPLPESELKWTRLVSARDEALEVMPALPDRPLVIRPESPVLIFPGRYAGFYVSVPVWLRFVAVSKKERTDIIDIPSRVLSNTWFGDPAGGEICYSLDAPLSRSHESASENSPAVICSLIVRNGSQEKLNFERICIHVENLSIFESEGALWTNEIKVLFKGTDQISQISIQNKPPAIAVDAAKLADPREAPNKNILRRSFSFIRQFAGI